MAKNSKGKKRLGKKQIAEMLHSLFTNHPDETLGFKHIFKALRLNTHPAKMIAVDVMEEMAWDDFLCKAGESAYRLNLKGQTQEGTFQRKASGRNSFKPDDGGTPIFVAERNSMFAATGDRVQVVLMARRDKHIKEAVVTKIIERAKDTFVGKLKVERDYAFMVSDGAIFAQDVFIPKKKLKGGKTGDKVVVRITQY